MIRAIGSEIFLPHRPVDQQGNDLILIVPHGVTSRLTGLLASAPLAAWAGVVGEPACDCSVRIAKVRCRRRNFEILR